MSITITDNVSISYDLFMHAYIYVLKHNYSWIAKYIHADNINEAVSLAHLAISYFGNHGQCIPVKFQSKGQILSRVLAN